MQQKRQRLAVLSLTLNALIEMNAKCGVVAENQRAGIKEEENANNNEVHAQ